MLNTPAVLEACRRRDTNHFEVWCLRFRVSSFVCDVVRPSRHCRLLRAQVGLGDIVSLAKPWKKLNAEDLLGGDTAALASAVEVLRSMYMRCFGC